MTGFTIYTVNGTTTMVMAEIAAKMGFSYVRVRRQDGGGGRVRAITASLEKLVSTVVPCHTVNWGSKAV